MNSNAGRVKIFSGRSVENVKLSNLTFDLNLTGQQVDFRGDEVSPLSNIEIENCVFKRLGEGCWGLAVDYDYPQSSAPTKYNRNIIIKNCLFDGTGAKAGEKNRLELAIFSNCQGLDITECVFQNVPEGEKDAGLAIYGYCRDVMVSGNRFLSNVSDMYIQQSTSVTVEKNYFGRQVRIMDSRSITVKNNDIRNLQIIDFDSADYDANPSQYRGSRGIKVSNSRLDTQLGTGAPLSADNAGNLSAIEIRLHNNIFNMPKHIEIAGNHVVCARSFVLMKDMRSDAQDYVDDLRIWNNTVEKTSATLNQGIIELRTNSRIPKEGLNNCFIMANYFARSSVSKSNLPWDVLVTTSGANNFFVDSSSNHFNNLGLKVEGGSSSSP
jgi:hypothetical protein